MNPRGIRSSSCPSTSAATWYVLQTAVRSLPQSATGFRSWCANWADRADRSSGRRPTRRPAFQPRLLDSVRKRESTPPLIHVTTRSLLLASVRSQRKHPRSVDQRQCDLMDGPPTGRIKHPLALRDQPRRPNPAQANWPAPGHAGRLPGQRRSHRGRQLGVRAQRGPAKRRRVSQFRSDLIIPAV